jgi:Type I phosphodiesterase / nucleotide pyrophosphatase
MRAMTAPKPPVPRYGEASLGDLATSILAMVDVPGCGNPLGLEPANRACLLLVDGLGWELLLANRRYAPFLADAASAGRPLTAGYPATTASSLGSLGTGRPPGEHGLVGYTMAMPGLQRAFNCLRWSPYGIGGFEDLRDRFPPEQLQPEQTLFERAVDDGVAVSRLGPGEHATSGLSRAVLRGGAFVDIMSMGDLAAAAAHRLAAARRSLVYAYHADLDRTGHVRGVASDAWRLELANVDRLAAQIAERLPGDAVLVVTGDHGMVDLRPEERIDLADQPELAAGVRLLAGEARARHVHASRGAERDVLAAWQELLGHAMWVRSRDEAIADGWFGPHVPSQVRPRIGDVVAAAFGAVGVLERKVDPAQARLVGHHGSMTQAEQLVPLIEIRP